jgi:hypothetical protein
MYDLIDKIDKHYESLVDEPRYHLGCSEVGHKCDRWLWLSFRYAIKHQFPGRMRRLFALGHKWEKVFVDYLLSAGVDISHTGKDQINVDLGCHLKGSVDGIIYIDGKKAMTAEFKTANEKSFNYLANNGVYKAKYQHYIQMQLYMHATGTKSALYMAECKNDCRLYADTIKYNKGVAEKAISRAHRIALSNDLPEPISYDRERFECKYCAANAFCYDREPITEINCRTCRFSTPTKDSTWICEKHDRVIPNEHQLTKYDCHQIIPSLIWIKCLGERDDNIVYSFNGKEIVNGPGGLSTEDLINATA